MDYFEFWFLDSATLKVIVYQIGGIQRNRSEANVTLA